MEVSVLKFRVLDIMKLLEGKDLVYSRMQNWPRSAFLSLGGGVTEINALFLGNWSSCLGGVQPLFSSALWRGDGEQKVEMVELKCKLMSLVFR